MGTRAKEAVLTVVVCPFLLLAGLFALYLVLVVFGPHYGAKPHPSFANWIVDFL